MRRPPSSTLFPYTTLLRSAVALRDRAVGEDEHVVAVGELAGVEGRWIHDLEGKLEPDRKSTRLNSSHTVTSYAVFCLKKKRRPSWRTSPAALRSTVPASSE